MKARAVFALMTGLYLLAFSIPASAQKLKLGSSTKTNPMFFLPFYAAEENGFWKENGLEVEWLPFAAAPPMLGAVIAKELFIGMDTSPSPVQAVARGIPVKMVGELDRWGGFGIYVLAKSPMREPKDLKGARRIGVAALGGVAHAYAQVVAKALGMGKEVRFVGAGGVPTTVAALKAGAVDANINNFFNITELIVKGEMRELLSVNDYIPQPQLSRMIWATRDFIKEKPDVVKRTVRAILQANRFWKKDASWAVAKIKATVGVSEEAAQEMHRRSQPSEDGRLERKAIENVIAFLIEYNLMPKDKVPAIDELYTAEFLPTG